MEPVRHLGFYAVTAPGSTPSANYHSEIITRSFKQFPYTKEKTADRRTAELGIFSGRGHRSAATRQSHAPEDRG